MAELEETIPSVLLPCNSCSRTFRPDALSKHVKYCEKSLIKKRKVFDSAKQRIQGTDLAEYLPVITQKKKCDKSPIRKTQSKWKEKHMEFVRAIRAAKSSPSSDCSAPAPPFKPVDHEKCLYCDRFFGPKAYDRHLEWCKEHSTRIRPKSPASIQARERLEARTKYKAPLLNRTRRASISEKCSPKNCTRDPSPAERLTRTRSSSLSSRTLSSVSRETQNNVSQKSNTTMDSFKRNQPARNSRRSVSPMKKTTPNITKSKAVINNVSPNNKSRGRQVTSHELKNVAKREVKTSPKTVKDDIFSASCNISTITPGQNQKLKTRTPVHNSMENYDPYKSAERQMKELLGLSDEDDALVHSLVPQPPPVLNSLNSAFAKFSPIQSKKDPDHDYSNRSPDSDLDNDFERLEAESRITPTLADRCGGIVDKNFNPMSLSTISLCSTISIESFDNSRNNLRKGISSSAKVQSCDRKAQLPLQRSISVVETPRRARDYLKSNLKMEHLLFGVTGNNYSNNNFNDNSLDCDVNDSSSDNKPLRSSNELLKNSNSSLTDPSQAEQDLLKSVSEFEKLFVTPSTLNPYSPLIPNSSPANTLTPLDHIDKHRSQAYKFITDSAYNSLNRKSPQQESPVDIDNCSSGSDCSSTRVRAAAQTANFCHECGAKFPVLAAKFCCNCGVRRLLI